MTCAGRSRSLSLALPVSARTSRTSPSGNVPAITPRLTWSLTRMPAGRPAGARAIVAARPRASASMAQLHLYVNSIGAQGEAGVPVAQRVYGAGHYLRPHFIEPHSCTNVLIEGVTVRNAPFWTIHPLLSGSVTIRDVTVASQGPNDDGCDPESCNGVLIEGCHFDTKDDCIAIKSGRGRDGLRRAAPSQNIVIRDTRVSRGGGGVAIGSEEAGDVNNVYVDGLTGDNSRLSTGVLIKAQSLYGAGTVEQIYMRNVRLAGVQNAAITMTCYYGGVPENGP